MRPVTVFLMVVCMGLVMGFSDQITYAGVNIKNTTSSEVYNSTYTVTSYLFYDSSCNGLPDYQEDDSVVISDGNLVVKINYSLVNNRTFYIKPSISGDNKTCFEYTPSAQSEKSNNATNSQLLQGKTPSTLTIAGGVTGTLGSSVVSSLILNSITYTGLLGFNNLTKCGNTEILKVSGGAWTCDSDSTGTDTTCSDVACTIGADDTIGHPDIVQNRTSGIWDINTKCGNITGATSDLCTLVDTTGGNSSEQMIAAVNQTGYGYNFSISCLHITGGSDADYCADADTGASGDDTNTNVTKVQFNNTGDTFTLVLEQLGLTNLTATFTVDDAYMADTNTNVTKIGVVGFGTKTLNLEQTGTSNITATWDDRDTLWTLNTTVFVNSSSQLSFVQAWFDARYLDNTDTDTNTNVTKIQFNSTGDIFTLNLEQTGLSNLTATFTVDDAIGGNSTDQIRTAVNITGQYQFYSSDLICTDCIGATEITDSYVLNTEDTMTGNLTIEALHLENDATHYIRNNATCIQIKGDTSILEIC